jgi:acyl-CoA synthetase (AMP-forming)/AMP-acid ligase II
LGVLRDACIAAPDRVWLTFVDEAGNDSERLTTHAWAAWGEAIARDLVIHGLQPGDRALLVYPPSLDFAKAFVGCLMAGVIPVPVYPPNPLQPRRDLAAFSATAVNSGARAVLTNGAYARARAVGRVSTLLGRKGPAWPDLPWHRTDTVAPARSLSFHWHEPGSPDETAFLQYTSGSTATPRGVQITHGNLCHELAANARDLGLDERARAVLWVPQYHDLGLISGMLSALGGNGQLSFFSPQAFLARPGLWFDILSRVQATHTAAPNFALDLAVRKTTPEQRDAWELGALQVLLCGGEPIRPATVRAFFDAFAASGLRREAFYAAYGLAEHTVSVSMGGRAIVRFDKERLEEGAVVALSADSLRPAVKFVSCGSVTKSDARVRIVDPETGVACGPHRVGEIWVDSKTKALGYHALAEETGATFHARLADDCGTRYLRTGDLGFFHDGELFVAGRLKDMIIVHGRNLYPQDIEASVRDAHPLIRPGGIVAFSVVGDDAAGEALVLFVELRASRPSAADVDQVLQAVRRQVLDDHGVGCHAIVAGQVGTVRKTTSGKVRRGACRAAFLSGELAEAPETLRIERA